MTLFQDPPSRSLREQLDNPEAPTSLEGRGAPTLRKYQRDQLEAICKALAAGNNRLLCKAPTGTGKTVAFAAMLKWPGLVSWLEQFPANQRKMLVIAHREELLTQAQDKIQKANPGLMVAIEQGDLVASRYADVVVASIQTLAAMKFRRLKRLINQHTFRIVVVDEAHHAAAPSYRTALVHLGFLPPADASESTEIEAAEFDDVLVMEQALKSWDARAPKDRLLVGVTATPNRSDAIGLGCVFQTIAYSYNLKDAIAEGYLVPPVPWVVETETSLDAVRITAGEFNQKDLAEAVNNERRNQLAVAAWRDRAYDLSTIAFTVDVAHAHALAEKFRGEGVRAEAISGETPKDERRALLRQFTEGSIKVLANCMVLTEGTDLPRTSCILHTKPTKSATLYEQMTGRGLRLYPGKKECVVIDVVDIARRHSLQTAPVLYGLPPGLVANGKTLDKVQDELQAFAEKYPNLDLDAILAGQHWTLEQLRAKVSTFDIWNVPDLGAFGDVSHLNWIRTSPDIYRLQYPWSDGTEVIQVSKDLIGKWEIVTTMRSKGPNGYEPARQRTIAAGIETSDAAARLAEAFIAQERSSVSKLKDRSAPWRSAPASPNQLALLAKKRIPHNAKTITKGQASDLLDLAFSRGGR